MSILRRDVNKLLIEIQNGKEDSKERLFNLTYNHLKIIARSYVHDKNDVEDVLQISYLKVFKYIESVNPNKDGYNWLCKIVQNEAYRYSKNNQTYISLDDCVKNVDTKDITDLISAKDEIYRYLEGYSELDCRLIYLKFYEDYSYSEIAEKMNMKKSNVHRRVSKVLKEILRKKK